MIVSLISGGDGYVDGACALGISLNDHEPGVPKLLMVESGAYADTQIDRCLAVGWQIKIVEPVRTPACKFKAERWPQTFTKLHVWGVDAARVIYIDADCLAVQSFYRQLIDRPIVNVGACWVKRGGDRLNAGVMILEPSAEVHASMIRDVTTKPPEETDAAGSDQGYLNVRFRQWTQIPDRFNYRWWHRPPGNLAIGHIRPHPWKRELSHPAHTEIMRLWEDALRRAG